MVTPLFRVSSSVIASTVGAERASWEVTALPPTAARPAPTVDGVDTEEHRAQVRDFLASRRERITPERAGLPAYGAATGASRACAAKRSRYSQASASTTTSGWSAATSRAPPSRSSTVSRTRCSSTRPNASTCSHWPAPPARRAAPRAGPAATTVRPVIQQVLDAITDAPAWVRNARHDILAMNPLARALYSPVLDSAVAGATAKRAANTTRFLYLDPAAREFFIDYDRMATDAAAMLRLEAGRNPHDKDLITLVGELSTQSELFRQHWASHNVKFHRSGRKRLRHPAVGELDLNFEAHGTAVRARAAAQHLHRRPRHPYRRRAQAARQLGRHPRPANT